MVPRATRNPTPLTATKPANSFVRSSVSRIASALTDNGRPLAPLSLQHTGFAERPPAGPDEAFTGTIAARPSQYDVGRTVAGHCRGPHTRGGDGSFQGAKRGPARRWGNRPGGRVDRRVGVWGD